jgi:hypothetical protein
MDAQTLIANLKTRGFTLTPTEGGIIVKPSKLLTEEDRAAIREHKAGLLGLLKWKADCAELFAEARAKVALNLDHGACPDCGGELLENRLGNERTQYCATCDFTWRAEDFAEIRAHLNRYKRKEAA